VTATEVRRELEVDAAILAIAAGLIHAVAAVTHFGEYWLFGLFFAVLAVAQVVWGALVYRGADRSLLAAGAWASAGVALLWLVTRTVGLPIGPDSGSPEAVGPLDALATLDELAIVLLVLALVRWPSLRPRVIRVAQRAGPAVGIGLTIASLVSLTLGVHAH
jgi:hypothetical protein